MLPSRILCRQDRNGKNMNEKHSIVIVDEAIHVIQENALFWKQRDKEAGGSLIGAQNEHASIIFYAVPTGPDADQTGAHIDTDINYQNFCIKRIVRHYNAKGIQLKYLVDWHLHPMPLPSLSAKDKNCCREILTDPIHSYLAGLPLILATFDKAKKLIYVPFWITLKNDKLSIEDASVEVVKNDDSRIRKILNSHKYAPLDDLIGGYENQNCEASKTQDNASQTGLLGNTLGQRLEIEINDIKECFGTQPALKRAPSGQFYIHATIADTIFIAVIPSEFPFNPPFLFKKKQDCHCQEFFSKRTWNSFARISDLLEEALEKEPNVKRGQDERDNKSQNSQGSYPEVAHQNNSRISIRA